MTKTVEPAVGWYLLGEEVCPCFEPRQHRRDHGRLYSTFEEAHEAARKRRSKR